MSSVHVALPGRNRTLCGKDHRAWSWRVPVNGGLYCFTLPLCKSCIKFKRGYQIPNPRKAALPLHQSWFLPDTVSRFFEMEFVAA